MALAFGDDSPSTDLTGEQIVPIVAAGSWAEIARVQQKWGLE